MSFRGTRMIRCPAASKSRSPQRDNKPAALIAPSPRYVAHGAGDVPRHRALLVNDAGLNVLTSRWEIRIPPILSGPADPRDALQLLHRLVQIHGRTANPSSAT